MRYSGIIFGVALAGSAGAGLAADLDLPPPTPAPSSGPRWEGPYLGLNLGGSLGPGNTTSMVWFPGGAPIAGIPSAFTASPSGFMGGGQIGFNKQWGAFVFGAESDFDFSSAKANKAASGVYETTPFTLSQSQQLQSLGTIRAKLGFTPIDKLLVYATGGLAFGQTQLSSSVNFATGASYAGVRDDVAVGFAVGGGLEYALDPNWSIGAEALYYDLGHSEVVGVANFVAPAPYATPQTDTNASFKGYTLRLGLNYEFDAEADAPMAEAPAGPDGPADPAEGFTVTLGARAGLSTSSASTTLYDFSGQTRLSRLTYHDPSSTTAEIFGRIDHSSGAFIKGYVGVGTESGGHLQDEDFPPATSPYSSTNSPQQYGSLGYASADVGYYALTDSWYKLGGLIGYHYLDERFNAFGCAETASNPDICPSGVVGASNLAISDDGSWQSLRLGVAGEATLPAGFSARAEAAWLPVTVFNGGNDHWLRMPGDFYATIPQTGVGHSGFQLEGEIDYALARNFNIGFGARYWSMSANGKWLFQDAATGGGPQIATFETQRLQAFAQSSYRF